MKVDSIKSFTRLGFVLAALLALAAGCTEQKQKQAPEPSAEFAQWVKAFSGGLINPETGAIRVEFAQPVAPEHQANAASAMSIEPKVKGEVNLVSPVSLEFTPAEGALTPGQNYSVCVDLAKLFGVTEQTYQKFVFPVRASEKEASLTIDKVIIEEADPDKARFEGVVHVNCASTSEAIQKLLSVNAKEATLSVGATPDTFTFPFTVAGVAREDDDQLITVDLKGGGFKKGASASYPIPGKSSFKIVTGELHSVADPYMEIVFSQPLSATQNLKGLVGISPSSRVQYDVKDNILKIYYDGVKTDGLKVNINKAVKDYKNTPLAQTFDGVWNSPKEKPAVKIPLKGHILADDTDLSLPFSAACLSHVDVQIIKIYENNVLTFLQDNDMDGSSDLRRSGRLVYKRTVALDDGTGRNLQEWNNYKIDLSGLFKKEKGALYRIKISFRPEYSLWGKDLGASKGSAPMTDVTSLSLSPAQEDTWNVPEPYYWDDDRDFDVDWDEYSWSKREDPDNIAYYTQYGIFPSCNLVASDIGVTAKISGGDKVWVSTTDLISSKPLAGADVKAYGFQLQVLDSKKTDADGFVVLDCKGSIKPYIVSASKDGSTTYLKVSDGSEKSLSRFDTGGAAVQKGLKAFIYGERGVWRPGDTLHLTVLLQQKDKDLPETMPVSMELFTPEGQYHTSMVCTQSTDGFYTFAVPTRESDPTGLWNAYFKVGGASFHKPVRIETIKPNRLKIDLNLPGGALVAGGQAPISITSSYLSGPPASGLQAKADMTLAATGGAFDSEKGFIFNNPLVSFSSYETQFFDLTLDEDGKALASVELPEAESSPGMLRADILTTVTEKGGDASFVVQSAPFSPYKSYVGINLGDKNFETDQDLRMKVVTVDPDGKRIAGDNIAWKIYKLNWSWWWDTRPSQLASFIQSKDANVVASGSFTSTTSGNDIPFRIDYPEWGKYLVYVYDKTSGHGTGGTIYIDWPSSRGRANKQDPTALTMLTFSTEKPSYTAGETCQVYIPAAEGGHALVSIENGGGVISRSWVATSAAETAYKFKVTPEMAPNFYIHITLLQPHASTANDLPIRMYGVTPVMVDNPKSKLQPVIAAADKVEPGKEFTVKISESGNRPMTYTLAIVDEGLLDISGFKTPDPWNYMYQREALGVRTFDMFDDVIGAYGGRFSSILAVGGDESLAKVGQKKDNRFKPVVHFEGPVTLKSGTATHTINLAQYIGSVRVMVVAGHDGAFGNAQKDIQVSSPLMVMPSLPAALCPGEDVALPVNVFATVDGVGNVDVNVKTDGPIAVKGSDKAKVSMPKQADALTKFNLVTNGQGQAHVTVTANGGGHSATETIAIYVEAPPVKNTTVQSKLLKAGETANFKADGSTTVELTTFPALNFDEVAQYAIDYNYSCSEQVSARGIALANMLPYMSEDNQKKTKELLPKLLSELYSRQCADGGFCYWKGDANSSTWVSSMAGEFMNAASKAGIKVSPTVLNSWKRYQTNAAKTYKSGNGWSLDQAYRLYTLALAGSAQDAAMNRLKEEQNIGVTTQCMLSAAYSVLGKKAPATALLEGAKGIKEVDPNTWVGNYGSYGRDNSIALLAYTLAGDISHALETAQGVVDDLRDGYCTQEMAFASAALCRLADKVGTAAIDATIVRDGAESAAKSAKSTWREAGAAKSKTLAVRNNSQSQIYATVVNVPDNDTYIPVKAAANGLSVNVVYITDDGKAIDPASIKQGEEFKIKVTVQNPSRSKAVRDVAVRLEIPSGWEVTADRMLPGGGVTGGYNHQDIRDKSSIWYVDMPMASSKTFILPVRAAYLGTYILPAIRAEAMYDPKTFGTSASGKTTVTE